MIEKQNPVQMVDLMLDGPRFVAHRFGAKRLAVAVECVDHDSRRPLDVAESVRNRKTAFFRRLMVRTPLDDERIDEHEGRRIFLAHVHHGHALRDADLVRGEADALGGAHRLEQIVHEPADVVIHRANRGRLLSQQR